jgi:hypothetical protein
MIACTKGPLTVFTREKGFATQHLRKDAANTPHIDSFCVFFERQHDLGCTIPSSSDIFSHESRVVFGRSCGSGETEVTDFEVAVGIEKKIGRFQVTMQNICRMHGLQCAESLVDEVLAMIIRQVLGANDTMHVRLHQFLGNV